MWCGMSFQMLSILKERGNDISFSDLYYTVTSWTMVIFYYQQHIFLIIWELKGEYIYYR
eukprot:UN02543